VKHANAKRRLSKRTAKNELSTKGSLKITVEGPWFFSTRDEDVFFSWLNSVTAVIGVSGRGTDLEITLAGRRLSRRDLREMLAIFHRYGIGKRVLRQFDTPRFTWFRDPKKYWHTEFFGRRRPGPKTV
jgi:hypothetical protein